MGGKDFKRGNLFMSNLIQCVADAEIHISNEEENGGQNFFFTLWENNR